MGVHPEATAAPFLFCRCSRWPCAAIWRAAAAGEPGGELAGCAHGVIDHRSVDVQTADLNGVFRPPVPYVFDAQYSAALFGGDALAQLCCQLVTLTCGSCSHNVRSIRQQCSAPPTVMGTW